MLRSQFFRNTVSTIRHHWIRIVVLVIAVLAALALTCDLRISMAAKGRVYSSPEAVPEAPVALLLGTAKTFNGYQNAFYTRRIEAAVELYEAGRVRGILISGDNGQSDYNEPEDMRRDLIVRGVPGKFITLDYAGFRTLDSIVRAREIFGQKELIVVSQKFHLERALYLAQRYGITACGYVAEDPPDRTSRVKVRAREILARTAAVLDTAIGRSPRFLGKSEFVQLRPNQN